MSEYQATVVWQRKGQAFLDKRYSRVHKWVFDGGATVAASSSPSVVPLPYSDASAVDPEEALVASVASCHMLFFLHYAAEDGLLVESYQDEAIGTMGNVGKGVIAFRQIVLRPNILFENNAAIQAQRIAVLHERAHKDCFIANSLNFPVVVEPFIHQDVR